MTTCRSRYNRRSIRLNGYDYSQEGAYFVTICTCDREPSLGRIVEGEMIRNERGEVVARSWLWLAQRYPFVGLDEWVVMPSHLHGIIVLRRGGSRTAPTKPLGRLVGAFKTVSTKQINRLRATPGASFWQRNYYEHVIRNEAELDRLRRYMLDNLVEWEAGEDNPVRAVAAGFPVYPPYGGRLCQTRSER
jgi:REP element-mobilizing transposase RayT